MRKEEEEEEEEERGREEGMKKQALATKWMIFTCGIYAMHLIKTKEPRQAEFQEVFDDIQFSV